MTNTPILLCILSLMVMVDRYDCTKGWYWREYSGTIPSDALVAGKDLKGEGVYIGQAYIEHCGLVVVQINEGAKEVIAPIGGAHKRDKNIKILCGSPENFQWVRTNVTDFQYDLAGKVPVIGGQEDTYGYMSIGRIEYGGRTIIGKVNSFWHGNASFYFIDKGEELLWFGDKDYEVLTYKEKSGFDDRFNEIKKEK